MKFNRIAALVVMVFVLSSCAFAPLSPKINSSSSIKPTEDKSLVLLSVSTSDFAKETLFGREIPFGGMFFLGNVIDSDAPFTRHEVSWHPHEPIKAKDEKSDFSVQIIALEPGTYEIGPHNFGYQGSKTRYRYGDKTSIFTVPASKFIYIGEVDIEFETATRKSGVSKGSDALTGIKSFSINNEQERY